MSLQSSLLLDLPDATLTLTFIQNSSTIDQITYSGNAITLATTSSFNLSNSDTLLYITYINTFFNALVNSFPATQNSTGISLPLSSFEIQLTSIGVQHINYIQTSLGNSVYSINYVPTANAASFTSRSQITITLQEFFLMTTLLNLYANQINLNP
jgi:hypothetical protein